MSTMLSAFIFRWILLFVSTFFLPASHYETDLIQTINCNCPSIKQKQNVTEQSSLLFYKKLYLNIYACSKWRGSCKILVERYIWVNYNYGKLGFGYSSTQYNAYEIEYQRRRSMPTLFHCWKTIYHHDHVEKFPKHEFTIIISLNVALL